MNSIVVGVDGSEESARALRWAVDMARLGGASVEAIYAYDYKPSWTIYGYGDHAITAEDVAELRERAEQDSQQAQHHAQQLAEGAVAALGDAAQGVPIETVAVQHRRPALLLVERSQNADMLVVGSRGRGGFTGLLLGSVSQQCAQHATCPVVIIRGER